MTLGESFSSILQAARLRAEWAWAEIYRDLAPTVLGYLRARGAHDPEDLLGDVFLRVVRKVSSFSGDERQFRAWVLTIAHHRLLDDHRARTRRPVTPASDEVLEQVGDRGDAEEEAIAALEANLALKAVQRLSPDQQDVILLRLLGELNVEEVARALGKKPGAVKALQRRALAALKKEISKQGVPA